MDGPPPSQSNPNIRHPWGARPRTQPDPGSPEFALLATLAVILFIAIVTALQQLPQPPATQAAGQPPGAPGSVVPPVARQTEFIARAGTQIWYAMVENPRAPKPDEARLAAQIVDSLADAAAESHVEHLRQVMLIADLQGADAALHELDALEAREPHPELQDVILEDAATLRAIYTGGDPPAEALAALQRHHGWFGRLAATWDLPEQDPARQAAIGGGTGLIITLTLIIAVVIAAFIAGFAFFITGIVKASTGTLPSRFAPPMRGGSVALETVAVFIAGFIALKLITGVVEHQYGPEIALWFALSAQWTLAALIFFPLLRGVPAQQWFSMIGFHRGRGFIREIGAGVVGYLACLPLLLAGIAFTLIVVAVQGALAKAQGQPAPTPQNPIFELAGGGRGPGAVIMLFLLASLWAPLVEEVVFRGALYRHLRSAWHWLPAGIVTALAFGLMHGYPILMLGPVIALGFGFALIREWRGSLIASMTAHCIHNAATLLMLLTVFRVMGL